MWERHIKKYHVDEIEYVSFNLGDFGLARAADDLVHTFCWMPSKSVSLEELLGHGTLSRHPNEGNLHHRASDGLNLDWLQGVEAMCVFIFSCFMIKCKISAWNLSLDLFFFYHPMQKLASLSSSWSSSTNFWCRHQTVNFLFFFLMIFFQLVCGVLAVCDVFKTQLFVIWAYSSMLQWTRDDETNIIFTFLRFLQAPFWYFLSH